LQPNLFDLFKFASEVTQKKKKHKFNSSMFQLCDCLIYLESYRSDTNYFDGFYYSHSFIFKNCNFH